MKEDENQPKKQRSFPIVLSQLLLVLLVIGLVILTIWISGPLPERNEEGIIITPQATATTMPSLFQHNQKAPDILETTPTSGVIVGMIGVVMIILAGTFIAYQRQK
jgi:alkyl hydroperoxide reductase subunit AhpF